MPKNYLEKNHNTLVRIDQEPELYKIGWIKTIRIYSNDNKKISYFMPKWKNPWMFQNGTKDCEVTIKKEILTKEFSVERRGWSQIDIQRRKKLDPKDKKTDHILAKELKKLDEAYLVAYDWMMKQPGDKELKKEWVLEQRKKGTTELFDGALGLHQIQTPTKQSTLFTLKIK